MFALLGSLPLVWRLASYAVVALIVVAAYGYWHHRVYQSGYDAAIAAVAKLDQEAIARVKEGVSDVSACRAHGGTWDVTTGTCK